MQMARKDWLNKCSSGIVLIPVMTGACASSVGTCGLDQSVRLEYCLCASSFSDA